LDEENSKLKMIWKLTFSNSGLNSITIPAATEEVEGSAFADRPVIEILVAVENRNFRVQRHLILTFDGTEVVRCFGMERAVFVPQDVEILRESSFESCHHIQTVVFEEGSRLKTIGCSALADCKSLIDIAILSSVGTIDDEAFRGCHGLEHCLIGENGIVAGIGMEGFAECHCLRSFSVPRGVESIGQNCFRRLHGLAFRSGESLKMLQVI
jgi:hypothetical protein